MTDAQYKALQETLQVILQNQQALNDNLNSFAHLTELRFQTLDGTLALNRTATQLADAHVEVVREEARLIKQVLLNEVLPSLATLTAASPETPTPLDPAPESHIPS